MEGFGPAADSTTALQESALDIDVSSSVQQLDHLSSNFLKVKTPFRMQISGPTMCGNS